MGVTQFLSLFLTLLLHWMLSYRICQPGGLSHGSGARRMGNPLSSGGIQIDSILILPSLSILPCPRSYRFGIYPITTYPIYPILSSTFWRGILRIILILPVLSIPPCPRSYMIGVYPNPTYSIYHILSYRRPSGGVSYGLDNRLAA